MGRVPIMTATGPATSVEAMPADVRYGGVRPLHRQAVEEWKVEIGPPIVTIIRAAPPQCPLENAEAALSAVTEQCAGSCYWTDGGSEDCLCNKLFDAIKAIRAKRTEGMVPL